jgi:hypothetical protein
VLVAYIFATFYFHFFTTILFKKNLTFFSASDSASNVLSYNSNKSYAIKTYKDYMIVGIHSFSALIDMHLLKSYTCIVSLSDENLRHLCQRGSLPLSVM